ncbi:MAG: RNA polymerase sporulation sigma factor SigK [Bacteroides sp.]|nr:RNA polymerase sporulation sigma factor SigK [Eubacterium sp.]MCM1417430.1 RNA polymerase sporulation sigma factor SigK [Roseburia sp.]MCM1461610.1 RNA polymerase sporulation sigma factor SigK [Bacteroides sp.]
MLDVIETAIRSLLFFALRLDGGSYPRRLTKKEERELLLRIAEGDEGARNSLIEHNLRLVAYIVNKHYGDSREQEDLVSIGTIGLIKAAETFNPEKAISFSTYASTCIQNQIKMYFRKTKHKSAEVYMNEPIDTDKNGNEITIADIFKDDTCVDDEVDLKINMEKLYRYVNSVLDDRERLIVSRRYGLTGADGTVSRPLAQREVARLLGISRSYVSRIEKRALEKLKAEFEKSEKPGTS